MYCIFFKVMNKTKNFRRLLLHTFLKNQINNYSLCLFYPKLIQKVKRISSRVSLFSNITLSYSFFSFFLKKNLLCHFCCNFIAFSFSIQSQNLNSIFKSGFIKWYNLFSSIYILQYLFYFLKFCYFFIKKLYFNSFFIFLFFKK